MMEATALQVQDEPRLVLVEAPELSWLVCRECGHEAPTPGGLHKHVRGRHQLSAWDYYTRHLDVLRLRILANVKQVVVVEGFTPCWVFQGRRTFNKKHQGSRGYCQMRIAGAPTEAVHRLSMLAFHGQLPSELALHQCDHPPCCNPDHLRDGGHAENMAERSERGRTAVGEACGRSKLDGEAVQQARLRATWGWTYAAIGRHLEVDRWTIQQVISGATHRDVPYDPMWDGDFIPW